jgi:UDP-N-acetylglucosamine 4,6-dehydratase
MNILITGGAGFLGRQLAKDLVRWYPAVRLWLLDRNEETVRLTLDTIDSSNIKTVVGDIRDECLAKYAVNDMDTVFHLAAMKHIDFCEANVSEAVTINVGGTLNLLKFFRGHTFIAMSTDKAVSPSCCYGATKFLMERLVLERAQWNKYRRYMIVRSGNILASSGSVVDKWKRQLKTKGGITVTEPSMTRYFITVQELSDYIIRVFKEGSNGGIYIPATKSLRLAELAQAIIKLHGNSHDRIEYIGLRQGEKLHEKLFAEGEAVTTDLHSGSSEFNDRMTMPEILKLLKGI